MWQLFELSNYCRSTKLIDHTSTLQLIFTCHVLVFEMCLLCNIILLIILHFLQFLRDLQNPQTLLSIWMKAIF